MGVTMMRSLVCFLALCAPVWAVGACNPEAPDTDAGVAGSGAIDGGSGGNGVGGSAGAAGASGGGSAFLPCSPYPVCGPADLPVIIFRPDLSTQDCTCEPNPCGATEMPSCSCAGALCTKYPGVRCVQYAPGSGLLQCTEAG